ncbi:hypothetical protein [Nocardia sp. NPDC051463]|uniref:hypothetical protein n=1 Tax=Nocardia sp. NPDC051463 TaxID=3154845 RepID=UPI003450A69F
MSRGGFDHLPRAALAALLPELLLCGQLIDRSGLPHALAAFGRDGMTAIAIEEWQLASPVYTRRMQRALGFVGDDVATIFKGLQLDIGAPPQFMDFRFRVEDRDHGEFWLDHCGALMDVEPMGEDFVVAMCHTIEDPTFDATALATNAHAQIRPIHRPPRRPADRHPVCAWTVTIDPANVAPTAPRYAELVAASAAAGVELGAIDPDDQGRANYSGPLLSDLRFADFSKSALVRIADEVCLQHHLLTLGFMIAVRSRLGADVVSASAADTASGGGGGASRAGDGAPGVGDGASGTRTDGPSSRDNARELGRKHFTGIAGISSERIRAVLGLGADRAALAEVLRLHPAWNPLPYTGVEITETSDAVLLRIPHRSGAVADGVWPAMIDAGHLAPLDAMARGVNPRFATRAVATDEHGWTVEMSLAPQPFREATEVTLTRYSTGASFTFTDRGIPLPLTVL